METDALGLFLFSLSHRMPGNKEDIELTRDHCIKGMPEALGVMGMHLVPLSLFLVRLDELQQFKMQILRHKVQKNPLSTTDLI